MIGAHPESWLELGSAYIAVGQPGAARTILGKLQKLGVITYRRGKITVLDRRRLEQLSCECYAVVKQEYDRLLPVKILI